jgi:hypothetical protein
MLPRNACLICLLGSEFSFLRALFFSESNPPLQISGRYLLLNDSVFTVLVSQMLDY